MLDSSTIGKTVSFDINGAQIIGKTFNRVVVMGILDTDSARHYIDVAGIAEAMYPTLPSGTPTDYRSYQWVKVKLSNGDFTCLALPWIKQETVVIHTDISLNLTVSGINASDVDKVLNILRSNGYTQLASKVIS